MTAAVVFRGSAPRARSGRWSRLRILVALAVAVAVVAAAAWVVLETSVLGVRSVEVAGTERLTRAEVVAAADVRPDAPLARVDLTAVSGRIRALPAVASVEVERSWPDGLRIVVHERVAAALQNHGSSWRLVDASGVAFADVRTRPRGLPVVTAAGAAGDSYDETFRAALDVLADVQGNIRRQLVEVRAASPDQIVLRLTHSRTVVWGSPERGRRKATVLAALMTRKASVYDVSAPDVPTTRRG